MNLEVTEFVFLMELRYCSKMACSESALKKNVSNDLSFKSVSMSDSMWKDFVEWLMYGQRKTSPIVKTVTCE